MRLHEEILLIGDKVWLLVGMLLRNGQSCTPSQLSEQCHLFSLTSAEIESLCRLPLSPLCLSRCGLVTFSDLVFQIFEGVKERYAAPSTAFVWQGFPSGAYASVQEAFISRASLFSPQTLHLLEPGKGVLEAPVYSTFEVQGASQVSQHEVGLKNLISRAGSVSGNFSSRHYYRKRIRRGTFSISNKRQCLSIETIPKHSALTTIPLSGLRTNAFMSPEKAGVDDQCAVILETDKGRLLVLPERRETSQYLLCNAAGTDAASCDEKQMSNVTVTTDLCDKYVPDTDEELEPDEVGGRNAVEMPELDFSSHQQEKGPCPLASVNMETADLDPDPQDPKLLEINRGACYSVHLPSGMECPKNMNSKPDTEDAVLGKHAEEVTQATQLKHEMSHDAISGIESNGVMALTNQASREKSKESINKPPVACAKPSEVQTECASFQVVDTISKGATDCITRQKHETGNAIGTKQLDLQMLEMNQTDAKDDKGGGPMVLRSRKAKGKGKAQHKQKTENARKANRLGKIMKANSGRSQAVISAPSVVSTMPAEMQTGSKQVSEPKLPSFKGFAVEAVEGSGGYGTVYKAMRKADGVVLAIKCPFEKTSFKYVLNEIKVLQKYGGQNFIPRCVGVLEESGRQCLILEYIEHEKPEVLKKEISISELQWYGFTLFKALAYLHGKGVVHRDVKPGNFLFSRRKQCGWLVDFNLATVVPKQISAATKSRKNLVSAMHPRMDSEIKKLQAKELSSVQLDKGLILDAKSTPERQSLIKLGKKQPDPGHLQERSSTPSGTPTRDMRQSNQVTSSSLPQPWHPVEVTPKQHRSRSHALEPGLDFSLHSSPKFSAHRISPESGRLLSSKAAATPHKGLRPLSATAFRDAERTHQTGELQYADLTLPRFGRRELWELVHKNQQSPQPQVASLSSSQKKRVAAPPKRKHQKAVDEGLHQSTSHASKVFNLHKPIAGRISKTGGIYKVRKEGPCAGTKGYRAPEVLLKSLYQSEKIDIWSAGVSLFQLLLGKPPFSSSSNPEQSLLDIAQFVGSEAIVTLAKEHQREASLPKDLLTSKVDPVSVDLWCQKNVRRSDILACTPSSLYDLIDKCLQVNPQKRISAKEALQHEFFHPCHPS